MEASVGHISKIAITGIDNSEDESFIAGALYEQGWNIHHRALEADSLISMAQQLSGNAVTIFISPELEGLDGEKLEILKALSRKLYIFSKGDHKIPFEGEIPLPATSLDLANLLRESHRAPMFQQREIVSPVTAKIFGISSASHGEGCTTLAINFAYELVGLGHSVLLVDADPNLPSIAVALDERSLHTHPTWKERPSKPALMEISRENIRENIDSLNSAARKFDFIIVDLAPLVSLSETLISRRWQSEAMIWISKYATELWILSTSLEKSNRALKARVSELQMNEIKPRIRYFAVATAIDRKSQECIVAINDISKRLASVTPITIPYDPRNAHQALVHQKSLAEVNQRGELRKAIRELAEKVSKSP